MLAGVGCRNVARDAECDSKTCNTLKQLRSESIIFDQYFIVAIEGEIQFKSLDSKIHFEPFNLLKIVSQELKRLPRLLFNVSELGIAHADIHPRVIQHLTIWLRRRRFWLTTAENGNRREVAFAQEGVNIKVSSACPQRNHTISNQMKPANAGS